MLISVVISCTKELPYPDLNNEDLIVLNGFLSPESGVKVHISQSCHVTDVLCDEKSLSDAKVYLKDNSGTVLTELLHSGSGIYESEDFEINQNTSYEIEASHASLTTVKAKTSSPKSFNASLVDFDEEVYQDHLCRTFTIEIDDNPDETNYYLVNGFVDILNGEHDHGTSSEINGYFYPHTGFLSKDVNSENQVLVSSLDIIPYPLDYVFLKDENFNGEKYQLNFGLLDFDLMYDKDYELEATINVKSVSKEMFDYYRSITLFKLNSANALAEPEQIFSNIENGIGIFGGYTEQKLVVDLPKTGFWFNGNLQMENENCTGPCTVKFSAEMGDKLTPIWDFGDGNTSFEISPEHRYENSGNYNVSVTVALGNDSFSSSSDLTIN